MNYKKIFDPSPLLQDFRTEQEKNSPDAGDRRDGKVYLHTEPIVLAVNVAIATGRPLLVQGGSGSGKSSLAYNVARVMKSRYYEYVVNSRTQPRDLLWRFDAVRRLGDAQANSRAAKNRPGVASVDSYYDYIEPGILWWVFDRRSARRRGRPAGDGPAPKRPPLDPAVCKPTGRHANNAVILIDEIDKAEPDFPNNLLVPLGSKQFTVDEIQQKVSFHKQAGREPDLKELPLVIITTNQERRLPQAFLRRCVVLDIADPTPADLVRIAVATEGNKNIDLYSKVAEAMKRLAEKIEAEQPSAKALSIAEYLDAVRACIRLQRTADSELLESIVEMTTWKEREKR